MSIIQSLKTRRSYYNIHRNLPVDTDTIVQRIEQLTELVPDAFNMKSSRVVVALDQEQDHLWDAIYTTFEGKVPREKIDSFKAGAGTVLYFYDEAVVRRLQEQFPLYADNFPGWALQASGMLQLSIWSSLRELGVGASLQHYNPVIDEAVRQLFDLPESWRLIAQMPFGGIGSEPDAKPAEADIRERVRVLR